MFYNGTTAVHTRILNTNVARSIKKNKFRNLVILNNFKQLPHVFVALSMQHKTTLYQRHCFDVDKTLSEFCLPSGKIQSNQEVLLTRRFCLTTCSGEPSLVERVLALQEVEGSTPTGVACPNDFSDPTDQDIRTQ